MMISAISRLPFRALPGVAWNVVARAQSAIHAQFSAIRACGWVLISVMMQIGGIGGCVMLVDGANRVD